MCTRVKSPILLGSKLFRWAHISRGNVTKAEMMHMTGLTAEGLDNELETARRLGNPLDLGRTPGLTPPALHEILDTIESGKFSSSG